MKKKPQQFVNETCETAERMSQIAGYKYWLRRFGKELIKSFEETETT